MPHIRIISNNGSDGKRLNFQNNSLAKLQKKSRVSKNYNTRRKLKSNRNILKVYALCVQD